MDSLPLRCAPAGNDTEGLTLCVKLRVIPGERSEGRGSIHTRNFDPPKAKRASHPDEPASYYALSARQGLGVASQGGARRVRTSQKTDCHTPKVFPKVILLLVGVFAKGVCKSANDLRRVNRERGQIS